MLLGAHLRGGEAGPHGHEPGWAETPCQGEPQARPGAHPSVPVWFSFPPWSRGHRAVLETPLDTPLPLAHGWKSQGGARPWGGQGGAAPQAWRQPFVQRGLGGWVAPAAYWCFLGKPGQGSPAGRELARGPTPSPGATWPAREKPQQSRCTCRPAPGRGRGRAGLLGRHPRVFLGSRKRVRPCCRRPGSLSCPPAVDTASSPWDSVGQVWMELPGPVGPWSLVSVPGVLVPLLSGGKGSGDAARADRRVCSRLPTTLSGGG